MAGLSNARMTGTTKLDRIGKRAQAHRDTVFDNLGHVITERLLRVAYEQLERRKAVGIDKVDKTTYGEALTENISILIKKIRRRQYRPKASRIVEIPKEDGSIRPLAISCFEDKMVQMAVTMILEQIFEPLFLPCSYGFRPNRNCHDALRAVNRSTYQFIDGATVEIDIRKCFNTIPHGHLRSFIRKVKGWINYHAISDNKRRVLSFIFHAQKLVHKWLNRRGGNRYIDWENTAIRLNRVGFPRNFRIISMFAQTKPDRGV